MGLSKHSRRFILTVSEIDCELLGIDDTDLVTIEFAGKVLPSTKKRIIEAIMANGVALEDKVLT